MLSFRQFIYLTEAKAQDIIRGIVNRHIGKSDITDEDRQPHIERATAAYNEALKHKVNPSGFKTIDELEQATAQVKQAKEQKQALESDIQTIHHDPKTGVTIKQVNSKEACIKGYGGGKTNWCVAATGSGNVFKHYKEGGNRMFTIHHKNPETGEEKVYGMHEIELGDIRDNKDKVVKHEHVHPDIWKAMANTPEMHTISSLANNPHHSRTEKEKKEAQEHVNKVLNKRITDYPNINDNLDDAAHAVLHPLFGTHHSHITTALESDDDLGLLQELAIKNPNATPDHITKALNHPIASVREAAIKHPNATPDHITKALNDSNAGVRKAAIQHPNFGIHRDHIKIAYQV